MIPVETNIRTGGNDFQSNPGLRSFEMFNRIISHPGDGSYYAAVIKRDWTISTLRKFSEGEDIGTQVEEVLPLTWRREFMFGSQLQLQTARGNLFNRFYRRTQKEAILQNLFTCNN